MGTCRPWPPIFLLLVVFSSTTVWAGIWNQPNGLGTPILLRFSYSNLFGDGGLDLSFPQHELVQEVGDTMTVFTRYVPITFLEIADGSSTNIRIRRTNLDGNFIGVADLPPNDIFTETLQTFLDDSDRVWSCASVIEPAAAVAQFQPGAKSAGAGTF